MSPKGSPLSDTYIALLRGINVGGKNKLPMATLSGIVSAAGGTNVRTYIQSGNVVFESGEAEGFGERLTRGILEETGLKVPVIVLTRDELAAVVAGNPFLAEGAEPEALHAVFLAEAPGDTGIRQVAPELAPDERFTVVGRTVYLCCPNGIRDFKATDADLKRLMKALNTWRNWRTTMKVLELAGGC